MNRRYLKALSKCAAALGLFHVAATLFVRQSNLALLAKTRAIAAAGFLALPNPATQPPLESWEAALCGALFFTLTSGAMALCAALAAPGLHAMGALSRNRARVVHALILAGVLLLVGISRETLPLLLGATGVFLLLFPSGEPAPRIRAVTLLFHTLIPLLVALGIAGTHVSLPGGLFSGFRDAFLFDNKAGDAVRDFYYTYTLFPAEAFKRLDQRSQVTVQGPVDPALGGAIIRLGHIPVSDGPRDYTLSLRGDTVVLSTPKEEFTAEAQAFIAYPGDVFSRFSFTVDPFDPLRTFTWYALFSGFPLLVYLLVHAAVTLLARLFCPMPRAIRIATVGVTASAAALVLLLALGLSLPESTRTALSALSDPAKGDTARTEAILAASDHPSALVRYRAALAVPRIRHPLLKRDLLVRLVSDRDINVVCQALGAMGDTGDRQYLTGVEGVVRSRPEWYVQWYGYRAMGRLGWRPHSR